MKTLVDIGEKIKKLRIERKLTMRELGEKIGVTHAHISKMESGINSPSVDLLEKLSKLFHIDMTYFFSDDKDFTDTEKDIINERDLSLESLKGNYNLEVDGKPATDEEIEKMIEYIKIYRIMKENERS